MSEPSSPPRPNPRLALGLLAVILALQGLFAAFLVFGEAFDLGEPLQLVMGVAFGVYAVLIAAFVYGVWRRTPWARQVGMVAAGFGLAIAGLQIVGGDPIDRHFLGMLIDGALLYYLTKPNIREMFDA
jgi:hypothetical protein